MPPALTPALPTGHWLSHPKMSYKILLIMLIAILFSQQTMADECTGNICSPSVSTTVTNRQISHVSPRNVSGDSDGNVTFVYNISSANSITNCSLIINGTTNKTNTSITKDTNQSFDVNNMQIRYTSWNVNCTESNGTILSGNTFYLGIYRKGIFSIDELDDEDITNNIYFSLYTSHGKVNFSDYLNMSEGYDFEDFVNISSNRMFINSTLYQVFNISAQIVLEDLTFTDPRIMKDGVVCPSDICTKILYSGGTLTFNVTHFTEYKAEETPSGGGGGGSGGGGGYPLVRRIVSDILSGISTSYDIIITVEKSRYLTIDSPKANVVIYNYGISSEYDIDIVYYLISPSKKIYSSSKRVIREVPICKRDITNMCDVPSTTFDLALPLPPNSEGGEWRFVVERGIIVGFDTFYVSSAPIFSIILPDTGVISPVIWVSFIVLIIILIRSNLRARSRRIFRPFRRMRSFIRRRL